jgi:hypothetical protein
MSGDMDTHFRRNYNGSMRMGACVSAISYVNVRVNKSQPAICIDHRL